MINARFIIMTVLTTGLLGACSSTHLEDVEITCKEFEFGENIVYCGPSGCNYSTEPIIGEINEPGGLTTITNLEEIPITVSYYPADDESLAIKNISLEPGVEVSRFAGLLGQGKLEIFRDSAIFKGKGDGADVQICFVNNKAVP